MKELAAQSTNIGSCPWGSMDSSGKRSEGKVRGIENAALSDACAPKPPVTMVRMVRQRATEDVACAGAGGGFRALDAPPRGWAGTRDAAASRTPADSPVE